MNPNFDSRDYTFTRADDDNANFLMEGAKSASSFLPGDHEVTSRGVNPLSGSPRVVESTGAEAAEGSFVDRAMLHVQTSQSALGFVAAQPAEFIPDPDVRKTSAGAAVVQLHQTHHGVPVFEMVRTVSFSPGGQIRDLRGDNLALGDGFNVNPEISAACAVFKAAEFLAQADQEETTGQWGETIKPYQLDISGYDPNILAVFDLPSRPTILDKGIFGQVIKANLVLFHQGPGTRLGWSCELYLPEDRGHFTVIVAADQAGEGEILFSLDKTSHALGEGPVFTNNPGDAERQTVPFPRPLSDYPLSNLPNPTVSDGFPYDWVEADETEGISTRAVLGDTGQILAGTPDADGKVVFNPADDTGDDQKVLNIFYFCNYMHDFFYQLGFDEAAGNFQKINPTGSVGAGDDVSAFSFADGFDGVATMGTPADGLNPTMRMGPLPSTGRHSAFDADVVFHEFVHGVTNRLVGGRLNSNALNAAQSRGQGEGWSDYFALTVQSHGAASEKIVAGEWLTNRAGGIRDFPYDSNFPDGFGALGAGRYTGTRPNSPHDIGEIWCAILTEMTRRVRTGLGTSERGYELCWQIVVDALKLSTSNPSFLDSRDAILQALDDLHSSGGITAEDHASIREIMWLTFVDFGMGINASSNGASVFGVVADDTLPPDLDS